MPTDLRENRTLESRPRLKATCIKLHELAVELGSEAKLPTMAELRVELGVSTYTLNDAIRELERRQVLRSVNGVGIYVTSRKKMLTGNIGLIGTHNFRQNTPYYSELMRGLENAVLENKQHLLFLGTDYDWDKHSCEKVDGILIAGIDQANAVIKKLPPALPVVAVLITAETISSVTADDYQGAKLAVQYLIENGHRRIACLMEKTPILSRRRFAGFQDSLHEAGIKAGKASMRLAASPEYEEPFENGIQRYISWGKSQMKAWLADGWLKTKCTAIFVQNEGAAIGVIQALQEEGIQVPQQVSVIGFDGTQICDYVSPTLCAVQVPLSQISAKAVEVLNHQIQHGVQEAQSIVFPLRIREGGSVASV